MQWDLFPQETVDSPFESTMDQAALLEKLSAESLTEQEFAKITNFVWAADQERPSFWTALCKRLIISLAKERLQATI